MFQDQVLDLDTLEPRTAREEVEKVYRSIHSERIRAVFRELIRPYFQSHSGRLRKSFCIGVNYLDKAALERASLFAEHIDIKGVLLLVIANDVPASLAADTIRSISVLGCISASDEVWEVIQDRCSGGKRL